MSTRTSELELPFAGTRNFPWRQFALAFLLTLLAVVLSTFCFAVALPTSNANRIVPGTAIAGVQVGGLDRASAEIRLRDELPPISTGHLSVTFGSVAEQITYAEIGRDYDLTAMLDQ